MRVLVLLRLNSVSLIIASFSHPRLRWAVPIEKMASGDPCELDTEPEAEAPVDTKTGGHAGSGATPMSPAGADGAADAGDAFESDNFYAEDGGADTGGAHRSAMGEAAVPRASAATAPAAVTKITIETAPATATAAAATAPTTGAPATGNHHHSGDGMKRPTGAKCLTCHTEGSNFEYYYSK